MLKKTIFNYYARSAGACVISGMFTGCGSSSAKIIKQQNDLGRKK